MAINDLPLHISTTGDYIHSAASISADDVTVKADSLAADQQIIDSLAGMGEHGALNGASLTDVLSQIQDTVKKHLMEHYEKEFMGMTEDKEAEKTRVYEETLQKIAKTDCNCPSLEYGAAHSASCPAILAKKVLNGQHRDIT